MLNHIVRHQSDSRLSRIVTHNEIVYLAGLTAEDRNASMKAQTAEVLKKTDELLAVARREQRIVITADLDYPRLIALQQTDRPGVILFRGGAYSDSEMLGLLDRVLARASTLDLEHSIVVVDRTRIRRRALPIGE